MISFISCRNDFKNKISKAQKLKSPQGKAVGGPNDDIE